MSFPTVYYITQVIPSCYSAGYAMCVCVSFGACVYRSLGAVEEMVCVIVCWCCTAGGGCNLASNVCKYDLRKADLFVLGLARLRRVRRGSLSSALLICGGDVRNILLLPLVARCLETIYIYIWRRFVFMSVVVTVWGFVGMCVV